MAIPTAILDVDGTLVDSNYHRAIGMGGDQLVPHLAGEGFDEEHGDTVRIEEQALFAQLIDEVQPFAGARGLIEDLKSRGGKVVLASSAPAQDLARYLDLLDARELIDGWTDADSVQRTKPAPDLVRVAIDQLGEGDAVMIGDSTWDIEAARALDVPSIAVRTGGFSADESARRARRRSSSRSPTCASG